MVTPNLSIEPAGGLKTKDGRERYGSLYQCATDRNLNVRVLKRCKDKGFPGFHHKSVFWDELQPVLSVKYAELEKDINEGKDGERIPLSEQKLEQEIIQLKLKNKQRTRELIDRKIVNRTLKQLATIVNEQVTKLVREMEPKLRGLSDEEIGPVLKKWGNEFLFRFSRPIDTWEEGITDEHQQ